MDFLKGRTNRATYWLGLAALAAFLVVVSLLTSKTAKIQEVVLIFLCIPRLHDLGRSGWWAVAPVVLEIIAIIAAYAVLPLEEARIVSGVVALILAGLLVWLGAMPGQRKANRFGGPPEPGIQWKRRKSSDA